jgi:hydrogenase expression/formation protein HypE
MLKAVPEIRCMRDPTRGGLASILNELCHSSACVMNLDEAQIPVKDEVKACTELLGLDPLYIANEGKLLAFCPVNKAEELLAIMRAYSKEKEAVIIGEVLNTKRAIVEM